MFIRKLFCTTAITILLGVAGMGLLGMGLVRRKR